MPHEDTLAQELADVLNRIARLPRPTVREAMLWRAMQQIADALGVEIERRSI